MNSKYETTQRWRIKTKLKIIEYAGGKCQSCGYNKCLSNLAFHHIYDKYLNVSTMINKTYSIDLIINEVNKCILVCHNCHGEIHQGLLECPKINHEERFKNTHLIYTIKPPKIAKPKSTKLTKLTKLIKQCTKCGQILKNNNAKHCRHCSNKNNEKINWPDNLPELVLLSSKRSIAMQLGVSDKAIAKRLKNHHKSE